MLHNLMSLEDKLRKCSSLRAICLAGALLYFFVALLAPFANVHAGNEITVERGQLPLNIGWVLFGGIGINAECVATSDAQPFAIRKKWEDEGGKGPFGIIGLPKPTVVSTPGSPWFFKCEHYNDGGVVDASDEAFLNVNGCTPPEVWDPNADASNPRGAGACEVPPPTPGQCGAAARQYTEGDVAYTEPQCAIGTASDSTFPGVGGSATWTCSGINGGGPSGTCTATRGQNGQCSAAVARNYTWNEAWPSSGYCSIGAVNPAAPLTSPVPGGQQNWTCGGVNGGSVSGTCTATRDNPPSCPATQSNGCDRPLTAHGVTSDYSCTPGYTNTCNATCNAGVWTINRSCTALPDISVLPTVVSAGSIYAGDSIAFTSEVTNSGPGTAGAFRIGGFYIDTNDVDTNANYFAPVSQTIANIVSMTTGAAQRDTVNWMVPINETGGTFSVGYIADVNQEVSEGNGTGNAEWPNGSNPSNNWSGWTNFTVLPLSDLTVSESDPAPGATINFSGISNYVFRGSLINGGGSTKPSQNVLTYLQIDFDNSTCANPFTVDYESPSGSLIDEGVFTNVANGSRAVQRTMWDTALRNGTHCYRFSVDPSGIVDEVNNSNNVSPGRSFTITNLRNSLSDLTTTNTGPTNGQTLVDPTEVVFAGYIRNTGVEATLPPASSGGPDSEKIYGDVEYIVNASAAQCTPSFFKQLRDNNDPTLKSLNANTVAGDTGPWTQLSPNVNKNIEVRISPSAMGIPNGARRDVCYRMIADRDNFVTELNNDNNAGTPWRFTVDRGGGAVTYPVGDLKVNGSDVDISITTGSNVAVTWGNPPPSTSVGNATACKIDPTGWTGLSGNRSESLSADRTYALRCWNSTLDTDGDSVADNNEYVITDGPIKVTVGATPPPGGSVSLTADPQQLRLNEDIKLIWGTNLVLPATFAQCGIYDENNNPVLNPLPKVSGNTLQSDVVCSTGCALRDPLKMTGTMRYRVHCPALGISSPWLRVELIPGIWEG